MLLRGGNLMLEVDKEYTISEVAELTGYPPHVLRYYEKEFELEVPRTNQIIGTILM